MRFDYPCQLNEPGRASGAAMWRDAFYLPLQHGFRGARACGSHRRLVMVCSTCEFFLSTCSMKVSGRIAFKHRDGDRAATGIGEQAVIDLNDPVTEKLTVIEFNPRMAAQFSDLYLRVDGVDLHRLGLELAFGRDPARLPWAEPRRPVPRPALSIAVLIRRNAPPCRAPPNGQPWPNVFRMRCCSVSPSRTGRLLAISNGWPVIVTASCILGAGMSAICGSGAWQPVSCSVGRHLMPGTQRKPMCRPAI
jgi:hypothetical protein